MPTAGSLSATGGFVPTVIRILAWGLSSPGAAIGTRSSSSLLVPAANSMVVSVIVALESMNEA